MRPTPAGIAAVLSVCAICAWLWTQRPDPEALDGGSGAGAPGAVPRSAPPCSAPLPWRVARVDPRFDVDTSAVRVAVERAAAMWERVAGRTLFVHDPERGLPVRLSWDERQQAGEERRAVERALEAARDSLAGARVALAALEARADTQAELIAEASRARADLDRQARAIEARVRDARRRLGVVVGEGARYSEVVLRRGDSIRLEREIRVWRFDDVADLERVIAHEMGHALGLGHATTEGAIMSARYDYTRPARGPLEAHPEDRELLRALCPARIRTSPDGRDSGPTSR